MNYCDVPANSGLPICDNPGTLYLEENPIGEQDVFIASFDLLNGMQWSTFFGGLEDDASYGVAIDRHSNALYYTGETTSTQSQLFPLSPWGQFSYYDQTYAGGTNDGYLARFSIEDLEDIVTVVKEEEFYDGELLLVPNPTDQIVRVHFPNQINMSVVEIVNLQGQLVQTTMIKSNASAATLDVSHLSRGVYLVRVPGSNWSPTKLIVL